MLGVAKIAAVSMMGRAMTGQHPVIYHEDLWKEMVLPGHEPDDEGGAIDRIVLSTTEKGSGIDSINRHPDSLRHRGSVSSDSLDPVADRFNNCRD